MNFHDGCDGPKMEILEKKAKQRKDLHAPSIGDVWGMHTTFCVENQNMGWKARDFELEKNKISFSSRVTNYDMEKISWVDNKIFLGFSYWSYKDRGL